MRAKEGTWEIASLHLILATDCNLRCGYCYQERGRARRMGWETLRRAIDWTFAGERLRPEVTFSGGEPLLAFPMLRRALEYARAGSRAEGGLSRFVLSTNGLLLDDEAVAVLVDHGCDLHLSFDGLPHAQDRRAHKSFDRLDRLLRALHAAFPDFHREHLLVKVTLDPEAVPVLADSFGYLLDRDVARISISPVLSPAEGWGPERICELELAFDRIVDRSLARYRDRGEIPLLQLREASGPPAPPASCRAMCGVMRGRTPAVDADGEVYGCAMLIAPLIAHPSPWMAEELDRLRIGSIHDPDLGDRLERFAERAGESRFLTHKEAKQSALGSCADCPAFSGCYLCPASIGLGSRNPDPDRVPDFPCAFHRTAWRARQRFAGALGG